MRTIKAIKSQINENDCNCGKQIKKTERKKIVYKKTINNRKRK